MVSDTLDSENWRRSNTTIRSTEILVYHITLKNILEYNYTIFGLYRLGKLHAHVDSLKRRNYKTVETRNSW